MNWLKLGKQILASKKGRENSGKAIKTMLLTMVVMIVLGALATILLFNIFICTISFGLFCGDGDGAKEEYQVVTDKEFVDMGEKMKELRAKKNKEADVPGNNYRNYTSVINGEPMNEAEVHLRALYQTDWYAMQGIDLSDEAMEERFKVSERNYLGGSYIGGNHTYNPSLTHDDYYQWALEAATATGWHPVFIFSQWVLETGHFKSPNFINNNNIAGQTWHPGLPESMKGTPRPRAEGGWYIKYTSAVAGYVDFVHTNPRYSKVKTFSTPEEQAAEVARQGWAVDPSYLRLLNQLIQQYKVKYGNVTLNPGTGPQLPTDPTDGDALAKSIVDGSKQWMTQGRNGKKITYGLPPRGELTNVYEMDCSSFTQDAFQTFAGISLKRDTIGQWNGAGVEVSKDQLAVGDLVFFQGTYRPGVSHVGIYIGNGEFIHNSSGEDGLVISSLSSSYYVKHWLGAKRVIGNVTAEPVTPPGGYSTFASEQHFIMIWEMAKKKMEITKSDPQAIVQATKEWDYSLGDWMMSIQFDVYRCYFVGDVDSKLFKPSTWFGDTPCEDLDDLFEDATGEKKKVIQEKDRGILGHTHTITEETWMCVKLPDPPPTPDPVTFNFKKIFFDTAYADHLSVVNSRGPAPNCGEGYEAKPGKNIVTKYISYPDLVQSIHDFETYTFFVTGSTVPSDESYVGYIDYMLKELYNEFFGDSTIIKIPGTISSNGWLVPMQEGTYYRTSVFGWRDLNGSKDFHYAVDMATNRTYQVPIYATKGGTVTFANPDSGSPVGVATGGDNRVTTGCNGNVIIRHDDGTSSTYCHMRRSDILVRNGWKVLQGQMIAGVGDEGSSFGHHLDIKICLTYTGNFSCKIDNRNPEKLNKDYTDPEAQPVSYLLNQDRGAVTPANLNAAVNYFKQAANAIKSASSESEKEKIAQTFLMPGYTPQAVE